MPRTTLAVRSYWLTMALSALVFAVTIVLTATSMAKVRTGGDDEGSGFGGTGRSGDFDGSGFGGTGSPLPYFGYDEEGEKARQEMDQLREDLRPVNLPEALRQSIEINLMKEKTELALVPPVASPVAPVATDFADIERRMSEPEAALQITQPAIELAAPSTPEVPAVPLFELPDPLVEAPVIETPAEIAVETVEPAAVADPVVAAGKDTQLAELSVPEAFEEEIKQEKDERLLLPERIQRPELPPIQRMRPAVERITISPPRPQPMRI